MLVEPVVGTGANRMAGTGGRLRRDWLRHGLALGLAMLGLAAMPSFAQAKKFICQGEVDRFEIKVDYDNVSVTLRDTQEKVGATITDRFISYKVYLDGWITNRIDRRTGHVEVKLNDRWQKSPLRCR